MKGVILTLAIVVMVVAAGLVVVNALQDDSVSVTSDAPVCSRSCTAGNSCGNPGCGVETTGSCGCGRG